jgi:hypothetical protein
LEIESQTIAKLKRLVGRKQRETENLSDQAAFGGKEIGGK